MRITDLFAGLGVASLAAEIVWPGIEHEFVEINPFAQTILKKHFPNSPIHADIKDFHPTGVTDIVWGSPPCQAASTAGKRKGTADDRWLWPEYFRVIREASPRWVVAENVRGLLSLNGGVEYGTLCADLEALGYEIRAFVIPALAVGAPHQRNRVWIIGRNTTHPDDLRHGTEIRETLSGGKDPPFPNPKPCGGDTGGNGVCGQSATPDTPGIGEECEQQTAGDQQCSGNYGWGADGYPDFTCDWKRIAQETCSQTPPAFHTLDDGPPKRFFRLADGSLISEARWRKEALKALGNSLQLGVVVKIFEAIRYAEPTKEPITL